MFTSLWKMLFLVCIISVNNQDAGSHPRRRFSCNGAVHQDFVTWRYVIYKKFMKIQTIERLYLIRVNTSEPVFNKRTTEVL